MTPEEHAELACAAYVSIGGSWTYDLRRVIANTIRASVLEEREACAEIADNKLSELWPTVDGGMGTRAAEDIATDIRARK